MSGITVAKIHSDISKGAWKPNMYLTNMSIAHFQSNEDFVADKVFPIVPVSAASSHYYKFSKADLTRDNVQPKPQFGKVSPAVMGLCDDVYSCQTDQVIVGLDQLDTLNYQRTGAVDPRRAKVRFVVEQMKIHLDRMWAKSFFNDKAWSQVYKGVASAPTGKQFIKWDSDNADPISLINKIRLDMRLAGMRYPNVLCLGVNAFAALANNKSVLERIKYTGSTINPAAVTENVLAQLFQVNKVVVLGSAYNSARVGKDKSEFICNPNDALLAFSSTQPAIDEPSAGYIFAWDMIGNGQHMAVSQYEGEPGTHSEYIEGLMAYDMKLVSDDLAVYLSGCVG